MIVRPLAVLLCLTAACTDGVRDRDGEAASDAVADTTEPPTDADVAGAGDADAEPDDGDTLDAADVGPEPARAHVIDMPEGRPLLASMAIAPDGARVYLGLQLSDAPARDNLWVVDPTLASDLDGATIARRRDSPEPLAPGARDTLAALVVDPVRRRLYAALTPLDASGFPVRTPMLDLVAWALDDRWDPMDSPSAEPGAGSPRLIDSGQPYHAIESIAVAPDGRWLYLTGFGEAGVRLVPLDADGWPMAGPPEVFEFGGSGKRAVFTRGDRLWAATYPGLLESVPLAADGRPAIDPSAPLDAACWEACDVAEGYLAPIAVGDVLVRLATAPYPPYELAPDVRAPLTARPLSPGAATATLADTRATAVASDGRALVWARETVFADQATGLATPDGAELVRATLAVDADGVTLAGPPEVLASAPGRYLRWLAAPAAGAVVALAEPRPLAAGRSFPSGLALTVDLLDVVDADGPTVADPAAALSDLHLELVGGAAAETPPLTPGVALPLESLLRGRDGAVLARVASYQPLDRLHLRARVDDGATTLQTMELDVVGSEALLFLPGGRVRPEARAALVESMDERAERYRDWARAVAPVTMPRPVAFPVSCFHVLGGQGSRRQLAAEVEAVARLGCNVVTAYAWGRLPASELRDALHAWHIERVTGAVYAPPSYFASDADAFAPAAIDAWIDTTLGADLATAGRDWSEVADLKIADEPGWYYPSETDRVAADPALLARFQGWVEALGEPAASYGVASFDELFPTTGEARGTPEGNRRFAATMRFFPAQAARAFRLAREALEARAGRQLIVSSNFNNLNVWGLPTPGTAYAINGDSSARSGFGSLDWLGYGRAGAANPWTEDWFPDRLASDWSLPGDYLRRMAELAGRPFGSYLIGGVMGGVPDGPSLKLLELVGRGLKMVDVWTFGPEPLFPGNCWSDNPAAYAGIAKALERLARIEADVLPGRPDHGAVALLAPDASLLWDPSYGDHRAYLGEPGFLAPAFTAANLDFDPLDDDDVAAGALTARKHRALVATGPNVAAAAQEAIASWVAAGGTLVLLPSAGVADELGQPSARFDELLGVATRPDERPNPNPWGFGHNPPIAAELVPTASGTAAGLVAARAVGPVQPLLPTAGDVSVLATDGDGQPLVIARSVGAGRVVGLGFWPGLEHHQGRVDTRPDRLAPLGDAAMRAYATLGPRLAGVRKRARVDQIGVETQVLESDRSLVVIVLNWTGAPIADLSLSVDDGGRRTSARALEAGPIAVTREGAALGVRLPLGAVEVLVFE
ncbi:MAG: hypothetical protein U1F43_33540 [Myxococcota bacterium]